MAGRLRRDQHQASASLQEDVDLRQDVSHNPPWRLALEAGASGAPVQTPDLVGQHYACYGAMGGQWDLERVLPDP